MATKRILPLLLALNMLLALLPSGAASAETDKNQMTAYLHAQGGNPLETTDSSTVYMGENADIYFAVDNPNKGLYENGVHKEPQFDMNGYTIKIYFDAAYFDYASGNTAPIDYTVPDKNIDTSIGGAEEIGEGTVEDVPQKIGYYVYKQGSGQQEINNKTYKTAYLTVFFSGDYVPQKKDSQLWYNLCRLPLKPLKTGSTDIFIDTSGSDPYTLELFKKNQSEEADEQTFRYNTVNGGYHHITIKDKLKPSPPYASPAAGRYTEAQKITLQAEEDCDIFYSLDGGLTYVQYSPGTEIEIEVTTELKCYAKRRTADGTEGKASDTVSYRYEILPKAPYLFDSKGTLIPNIYSGSDVYTVYASDKSVFAPIDDGSEIYYTFSDVTADQIVPGSDPETQWVKLDKKAQSIEITKKRTLRLVTDKMGELSEVSWYYLGIRPAEVTASHASGEYGEKIDVSLSCTISGAKIYYTIDGSDPIENGMEYLSPITLAKDTTLRAVSVFDGEYGDVASYYYLFSFYDNYGVDAFYPSGVYEGGVNVTLMPNDPENTVKFSIDGGTVWVDYTNMISIDKDTEILAKAVDKNGVEGEAYKFTYKIKPLPPAFAPESAQFTNADKITVYCVESTKETSDRFELFYTTDGSDPITSSTRKKADDNSDTAVIDITKYTVVSAVVRKDGESYSNIVTHSYDVVTKKPTKPLTTLLPGVYTRKIDSGEGFYTQFMPVPGGTEIYYTISYDGSFVQDPVPNTEKTIHYDGAPIEIKGQTIIKAVAVNVFGVKSDIGIFSYTIKPEASKAAPSATIGGDKLPIVPVEAVKGSTVYYEINGVKNQFVCEDGIFYLDTSTGNAYRDEKCTIPLGSISSEKLDSPAVVDIWTELDGVESPPSRYTYSADKSADILAPPYANKETGKYEEINVDGNNSLLLVELYSLNTGAIIQYRLNNSGEWLDYDNNALKLKGDTILQLRAKRGGVYSDVASYAYHFVPLAPVITLPSGRYADTPVPATKIEFDDRAPTDMTIDNRYTIWYRKNGDAADSRYTNQEREIPYTMSFKAYVLNESTGRVSANTIHYYIIESEGAASGKVYVANPYDVSRISADILGSGVYADGIKLLTQNKDAQIHYFYSYTKTDGTSATTNNLIYDNAAPIMVNSSMDSIVITAWLEDDGGRIENSDMTHRIEFVHLNVPVTSLGTDKVEFEKGTKYTIINDYPGNTNIILYYTLDGSSPSDPDNEKRLVYAGEQLTLSEAVTVKAVYFSACGTCAACKDNNPGLCWNGVYGKIGEYKYTVPTVKYSGGGGGGGKKVTPTEKPREYTKDIFGSEHPTHIGYIKGYPDGSVKPEGEISREEIASILYRIIGHEYEKPFAATGDVFPDVELGRWSAHDIEYMEDKGIIQGYPDGEFKPSRSLTRSEFAALICRFAKLEKSDEKNPFSDLKSSHWAYDDVLSLYSSGVLDGYEDGTFRGENEITRAEVMTVVNKLLGRKPLEEYVKSLEFNPYDDLFEDKWYYVTVLEATITHNYWLDDSGEEYKWEDWK